MKISSMNPILIGFLLAVASILLGLVFTALIYGEMRITEYIISVVFIFNALVILIVLLSQIMRGK